MEKITMRSQEVRLLVDLTKAYDNVPVAKLCEVLKKTSISVTLIDAIKELYNTMFRIKIGNKIFSG